MADKLDWLNQHPLWFIYPTVNQVVTLNHLNLSTPLLNLSQHFPVAEDFLKALWHERKFKDACTFCAYNTNPRVAVWWAYNCVNDLNQELLAKPAQKVDIADIAKPRELHVPDWCKKLPEDNSISPEIAQQMQELNALHSKLDAASAQLQNALPQPLVQFINRSFESTFAAIKARCGYDPREVLQECLQKLGEIPNIPFIDEANSPIFQASNELKQKLEKMRVETAELIKSVVPEEDLEKQAQLSAQCLDAVWSYITSPNELNAQRVFQLGNACPNQVEGLLASVAFWSYGSLTPNTEHVIKTPPGLMANGINGLLVKCAASPGGIYKPVERFERYFNLAFTALTNQNTWDEYVERNTSPHQELQQAVFSQLLVSKTPVNQISKTQVKQQTSATMSQVSQPVSPTQVMQPQVQPAHLDSLAPQAISPSATTKGSMDLPIPGAAGAALSAVNSMPSGISSDLTSPPAAAREHGASENVALAPGAASTLASASMGMPGLGRMSDASSTGESVQREHTPIHAHRFTGFGMDAAQSEPESTPNLTQSSLSATLMGSEPGAAAPIAANPSLSSAAQPGDLSSPSAQGGNMATGMMSGMHGAAGIGDTAGVGGATVASAGMDMDGDGKEAATLTPHQAQVQAQKRAAEQEMQERLARARALGSRRFRG